MKKSLVSPTLIFPTKRLPHHLLTLVYLLAIAIGVNGCKSSDPKPSATMILKMSIDGQPWEAREFLVRVEAATSTVDEHLWINAQDPGLSDPSKDLDLFIYDYKKTGTSTVDNSKNKRQNNGSLSFIDISKSTSLDYFGPITYTLTKVEGQNYQGTFSGTLCAYSCLTSVKPITVQGNFDVHVGLQTE
jgi:hypothetical protein